MNYMKYLSEQISYREHLNKQIVIKIWKFIANGGKYTKKGAKGEVEFFESIQKKLKNFSTKYQKTQSELCSEFLSYSGISLDQVLELWNIKAERQNMNEIWKKDFIEKNSKIQVLILPKSNEGSIILSKSFEFIEKKGKSKQSEKSKGMKSFDLIVKNSKYPNTDGFDGILTVDKTVKVTGGSQIDTQKEIDEVITHLSSDPQGRHYLILLDGEFWSKYVIEHKNKYPNVHITTSNELIK
jgi:hypothetical protein